ncbi:hypothetical protein BV20DRAFT_198734 [Pilatotrama ljubarskyi]|nr:hypothetical protein BV20DRAFT_198734 [Pilatotrama ljubarskyi]
MAKKKQKALKTLRCPLCDICFKDEGGRQQHLATASIHQGLRAAPGTGASASTTSNTVLQATTAGEETKPKRQWACHLCGAIVTSPVRLGTHYSDVHPEATTQGPVFGFCTPCYAFVVKGTNHFDTSPNHPRCFVCNEGFEDYAHLLQHMSTRNTCEACKIHYSSAQSLQEHNENTHFACGACGERFGSLDALVPHRLLSKCAIATQPRREAEPEVQTIKTSSRLTAETTARIVSPDSSGSGTNASARLADELGFVELDASSSAPGSQCPSLDGGMAAAEGESPHVISEGAAHPNDPRSVRTLDDDVHSWISVESFVEVEPDTIASRVSESSCATPVARCRCQSTYPGSMSSGARIEDQDSTIHEPAQASEASPIIDQTGGEGPSSSSEMRADLVKGSACETRRAPSAVPIVEVNPSCSQPPRPKTISWHCRLCRAGTCTEPVATACGHIFCRSCIVQELAVNGCCPVCRKVFFLRLDVSA